MPIVATSFYPNASTEIPILKNTPPELISAGKLMNLLRILNIELLNFFVKRIFRGRHSPKHYCFGISVNNDNVLRGSTFRLVICVN